jgi:hypothetical protein
VDKGAEAFTASLSDAAALTKVFSGGRAAYLMLPPAKSREEQERDRWDREGRKGIWPALRGASEQLRRPGRERCRALSFPTFWHYDLLRGLEYLRNAGIQPDGRVKEAIEILIKRRHQNGALAGQAVSRRL